MFIMEKAGSLNKRFGQKTCFESVYAAFPKGKLPATMLH